MELKKLIEIGLEEDLKEIGDITSDLTIQDNKQASFIVTAKEDMIIAGVFAFIETCKIVDKNIKIEKSISDGQKVSAGDEIIIGSGNIKSILKAERVALNILQYMCGIATSANKYANLVKDTKAKILDTRKILPGLREIAKYSVKIGGCENHRIGLFDGILIKDNHIKASGGVLEAVNLAKNNGKKVEVECETLEQVKEALKAGADIIMLDNMDAHKIREAVNIINGKALVEASGGVNLENIQKIAATGVDYISVGALTHSVRAADISLNIGAY